jgi:hypothetical protein
LGLKFFCVDSIAPFFATIPQNSELNWSKIPFNLLERNGIIDSNIKNEILKYFKIYCEKITGLGFNTITLDDVAHCVSHSFYPDEFKKKIESYQKFYISLFEIASQYNLDILLNTDVMFLHKSIISHTKMKKSALLRVFVTSILRTIKTYPQVKGIILRIGESDGIDVEDELTSRILIHTAKQARTLIRSLLPIFEKYDRVLLFRTWTLGAFNIGDLMWNKDTYEKTFGNITSENLIISLKFGESDFFRYLNFNPLFFETPQKKILELQTRREYEGFGEFPSFIGNDYEKYARYLSICENVVGISVWCQTGGWSHFTKLTFLNSSSIWNEINTFVTIRIFKNNMTAEEAVAEFSRLHFTDKDPLKLITLLKLSDRIIKELWYIPEFSSKRIYFRRNRVPPLLWIFWDNILINHTLRKIIRRFVHERKEAVHEGFRLLNKIKLMKEYAKELDIDEKIFDYQYDTFHIIASAREYYLGKWYPDLPKRIISRIEEYKEKYPHGFHIQYDFNPVHFKKWLIKTIFKLSLREHPHYRLIDKWFIIRFSSLIYPVFNIWQKRRLPVFYRNQAMGIQVLFK